MWDLTFPYQPVEKIKKQQIAARWPYVDIILMLKWRHHVASERIQDFLEAVFMFFK